MKGEIISINTARQSGKTYKMLSDMQKENVALRDELKKIKKDLELDENATYGDVEVKIYDDLYKTINEQCCKILALEQELSQMKKSKEVK